MDTQRALLILKEIKDEWYTNPVSSKTKMPNMKKCLFDLFSYQRWAIDEIRREILENENKHPIEVLEDFKYKMSYAACRANSMDSNMIFSIAYDVAIDVLDILKGGDI